MLELVVAGVAFLAAALLIGILIERPRPRRVRARRVIPQRQPELEAQMRPAFHGPCETYGEIFLNYAIWKRDRHTRMEVFAADAFTQLNEFTRCLVVRHLWRALERLTDGSVVVIDRPTQVWSREIDGTFDDHGIDPWGADPPNGGAFGPPQFAHD